MSKQEILVEVKIDPGVTEDKINKITNSLTFLNAETKDLVEINKTLEKDGKVLTEQYVENAKQIEINKNKIAGEVAERKTLVKALELEDNSLGALKASSKELAKERDNLNLKTKEGRDRLVEINKQLEDNKEATDKANMSGKSWKTSIDSVVPGFKGMVDGIESSTKAGLKFIATPLGATLALLAAGFALLSTWFTRTEAGGDLLAKTMLQLQTAFNIVLDRAALLGGALVKLFTGDFTGAIEDATKATTGFTEELNKEVEAAGKIADALDELEDRERSYAVATSETTNRIKELILESKNRTLTESQKIAKLQEAYNLEVNQNKKLSSIRGDALKATLDQIEADFNQIGVTREKGQSDMDFALSVVNNADITGEAKDKVAEKIIALNEVEGQSIALQEKLMNAIDAQNQKQEEKKKKLEEIAAKQIELDIKMAQSALDRDKKMTDSSDAELKNVIENLDKKELESLNTFGIIVTAADEAAMDESAAANAALDTHIKNEERKREEANKTKEIIIASLMATLDVVADIASKYTEIQNMKFKNESDATELHRRAQLASLEKQFSDGLLSESQYKAAQLEINKDAEKDQTEIKRKAFEVNKKNQIIQTTIDTVQSAVAAFRALVGIPVAGPVLAPIAAAAALVFGYAKIKQIEASQFVGAEGGQVPGKWTTLGGNYHNGSKSRGTQFVGSDGTRFLAEKDEGIFILKRNAHADFIREQSMRNMKFGGRSWGGPRNQFAALGGEVGIGGTQYQSVDTAQIQSIIEATVRNIRPVVYVESITEKADMVVEVESKANLL